MTRNLKHFTGRDSSQRVGVTRLRVLALIVAGTQRGRPPTIRELCKLTRRSINAVTGHIAALQRDGMVTQEKGRSRTLRSTCAFLTADQLEASR